MIPPRNIDYGFSAFDTISQGTLPSPPPSSTTTTTFKDGSNRRIGNNKTFSNNLTKPNTTDDPFADLFR